MQPILSILKMMTIGVLLRVLLEIVGGVQLRSISLWVRSVILIRCWLRVSILGRMLRNLRGSELLLINGTLKTVSNAGRYTIRRLLISVKPLSIDSWA